MLEGNPNEWTPGAEAEQAIETAGGESALEGAPKTAAEAFASFPAQDFDNAMNGLVDEKGAGVEDIITALTQYAVEGVKKRRSEDVWEGGVIPFQSESSGDIEAGSVAGYIEEIRSILERQDEGLEKDAARRNPEHFISDAPASLRNAVHHLLKR